MSTNQINDAIRAAQNALNTLESLPYTVRAASGLEASIDELYHVYKALLDAKTAQ